MTRNVLVTGGSGGIGRAICEALAPGAKVVFTYLRDPANARETLRRVRAAGGEPVAVRANLEEEASMDVIAAALGGEPLNVLVSNAASGVLRPATELEPRHWDWTLAVNARALLLLARRFAPGMPQGARIIAVSSLGASRAIPDYAAVGASKAALESLARHLAAELAPRGIAVNVVSPGLVETKALKHFPRAKAMRDDARRRTPAGRTVIPEDVAGVVRFLASPEAAMIVGQTVVVDGGYSILA
jgi:enoyl-[acyl-carrier protein] reductase III